MKKLKECAKRFTKHFSKEDFKAAYAAPIIQVNYAELEAAMMASIEAIQKQGALPPYAFYSPADWSQIQQRMEDDRLCTKHTGGLRPDDTITRISDAYQRIKRADRGAAMVIRDNSGERLQRVVEDWHWGSVADIRVFIRDQRDYLPTEHEDALFYLNLATALDEYELQTL